MALGFTAALAVWGQPATLKDRPGLKLIRLPKTRQATDYTCGVAAELKARWHDEESPGERISGLMLVFSGKAREGDPDAILLIE